MNNLGKILKAFAVSGFAFLLMGSYNAESYDLGEVVVTDFDTPTYGEQADDEADLYFVENSAHDTNISSNESTTTRGNLTGVEFVNPTTGHTVDVSWEKQVDENNWEEFSGEFTKGYYRVSEIGDLLYDWHLREENEYFTVNDETTKLIITDEEFPWGWVSPAGYNENEAGFRTFVQEQIAAGNVKTLEDLVYLVKEPIASIEVEDLKITGEDAPAATAKVTVTGQTEVVTDALTTDTVNIKWYEKVDDETYVELDPTTAKFESEKTYKYEFAKTDLVTTELYEITEATTIINSKEVVAAFSYAFLEETDTVTKTIGEIDSLKFVVDAKKENVAKVEIYDDSVALNLVETDYTLEDGCTEVVFTTDGLKKVDKLAAGSYTVKISYTDTDKVSLGELIIKEAAKKPEKEEIHENPNTGDNILVSLLLSVISAVGTVLGFVFNRKFN